VDWWIWVVIVLSVFVLAVDWVIVMGADPRRWKGGMREYEHTEPGGRTDHEDED